LHRFLHFFKDLSAATSMKGQISGWHGKNWMIIYHFQRKEIQHDILAKMFLREIPTKKSLKKSNRQ
jgi:hypothetical protein